MTRTKNRLGPLEREKETDSKIENNACVLVKETRGDYTYHCNKDGVVNEQKVAKRKKD